MRFFTVSLIILLTAIVMAIFAYHDPGYVVIEYHDWIVESSLILMVLLTASAFIATYALIRFWVNSRELPKRLQRWRRMYHHAQTRRTLHQGLRALAEGNWTTAERLLTTQAAHSETPLLNYLGAAMAAQQQGDFAGRDNYLKLAHESAPAAELAVGYTQAELQYRQEKWEQALATLAKLSGVHARHPAILKLLMQLHVKLKDWKRLLELLPELQKQKVISADEADERMQETYQHLLAEAAHSHDPAALIQTWQGIPRQLRQNAPLLYDYARYLLALGSGAAAEPLLAEVIEKEWHTALVYVYGLIETSEPLAQLARAEKWLQGHETDPMLLLTLGRICLRARLWGKSRGYLESSLDMREQAETYKQLGILLERLGERDAAMECYRKALDTLLENKSQLLANVPDAATRPAPTLLARGTQKETDTFNLALEP